jgi:Mn2+/Fe2+ NRAMP family transporter
MRKWRRVLRLMAADEPVEAALDLLPAPPRATPGFWRLMLITVGPGLVAMLADTDAGSVVTAAQSGAQWGYRLLTFQFAVIPFMVLAQELALRLGLITRQGAAELVRRHFGRAAGVGLAISIIVSCGGTLLTELAGLGSAFAAYGIALPAGVGLTVAGLIAMVVTGSYRSVEWAAICFGLFELGFVVLAWLSHPEPAAVLRDVRSVPWNNHDFLYLVAANLGTSIMPWTLAYQQSACVDKGLDRRHLRAARWETLAGVLVCQIITAAILIAAAAGLAHRPLAGIGEIAAAFTRVLGPGAGRLLFVAALGGSALVAAIVLSLTIAWTLGEALGLRHSLEHRFGQAPWFYAGFAAVLILAGVLVCSGVNLVRLSVGVGVLNALLLPVMLYFLFRLARRVLPHADQPRGLAGLATAAALLFVAGVGVVTGVIGMLP